ncbi:MAG: hypothetical protein ABEJ26_04405 [Halosimplex sp.]
MATIECSEDLIERIDTHREEDVSREEFLAEVIGHYEAEGRFLREGYSGEP